MDFIIKIFKSEQFWTLALFAGVLFLAVWAWTSFVSDKKPETKTQEEYDKLSEEEKAKWQKNESTGKYERKA